MPSPSASSNPGPPRPPMPNHPVPHHPVPGHLVRDRVLPYPTGHARRMTALGFVISGATFAAIWYGLQARDAQPAFHQNGYTLLFFVAAFALVPLHEGLHVAAALVAGMPWRQIQLGFRRGFIYVRFHRSLSAGAMRVVLLAPLVLLGIPLVVFSLRSLDRQWLVLFAAHVGSTVVDLYTYWRLRGVDRRDHVFQERGVNGLTVFRALGTDRTEPVAAPVLATNLLVTAAMTMVFVLGPFLVPSHALLGDRTLRRQRDMLTGHPLEAAACFDQQRSDGWHTAAYDFHVTDARAVRCTARAWSSGRLVAREKTEIPVTGGSGRISLGWGLWPPGPGPGRFAVRLAHGERDVELLSLQQLMTARATVVRLADDHRVRLDHSLPILHHFVTGGDLPHGSPPPSHVAGSPPERGGLPPGLEIEVRVTFVGADG